MATLAVSGCSTNFLDWASRGYSAPDLTYKPDDKGNAYGALFSAVGDHLKANGGLDVCLKPNYSAKETDCKAARPVVLGDLLAISDQLCQYHQRRILGDDSSVNIITGTLTNAFSGAATVVGGEAAKSALAAGAAFSSGERSLWNETVFKTTVATAVVKKIDESRTQLRKTITDKVFSAQPYGQYTINAGITDIIEYHNRCAFMYGLIKALDEGNQNSAELERTKLDQRRSVLTAQIAALSGKPGYDQAVTGMTQELDAINQRLVQLVTQGTGVSSTSATAAAATTGGTAPVPVQTAPINN